MRLVFFDCESYWDRKSGFSLSSMSTEAYIRDPRFELHGAAIKWSRSTLAQWYDERELRYILKNEDWSDIFLVSHHAQWDHGVLSMLYDVHPKMSGCTLAMSRLVFGNHLSVSLDSVRKYFGLPPKITPYGAFEGKHWHEMSPQVQQALGQGACDEVESKVVIFDRLLKEHKFPVEELEVIDSVVKMFTEPVLDLDTQMLADLWQSENTRKAEGNAMLGVDGTELRSTELFCKLLEDEGIDIEYKDGKNGPIPAIAKNDPFMRDFLREHDSERVRALAEARLAEKSTLLQTRAATLGWVASRGPAPVYLFYSGAGTLRPSGGDGCNWLNFKRGSPIRKAVRAPTGFYLAPVDASQIEFRVCCYLAGQNDVLDQLRRGEDPYIGIASEFYQEQIYKPEKNDPRKLEMEQKRGVGKQAKLMCQYGASGKQFRSTAKSGQYGPPVDMTLDEADAFVDLYRRTHPAICARNTGYWAQCERVISRLGGGPPMEFGPMHVEDGRIFIQGAPMIYDTIEYYTPQPGDDNPKSGWRVKKRDGWRFIWGSKLTQNICEGISRMIVSQAMIRIKKKYGIRTLNWPYDELLLLIPRNGREEEMLELCKVEMTVEPSWLPGLPLACDGALGERYDK